MNKAKSISRSAIVICTLVTTHFALGDIVAYDGFGGGSRPDIHGYNGGSGWSGAWTDNLGVLPTAISDGLAFPGLATTAGGAVTPPSMNLYDATEYSRSFGTVPGDRLYVSFLYRASQNYGSYGGIQCGQYPAQVLVGSPMGYYTHGFRVGRYACDESDRISLVRRSDPGRRPADVSGRRCTRGWISAADCVDTTQRRRRGDGRDSRRHDLGECYSDVGLSGRR